MFSSSPTQHSTLIIISSLCTIYPHRSTGVTLHTLPLFSLISCSHLSIHSLSTVVFMLCILIQPLPMHLLLLFCFSHNVLILGTIDTFTHIPLLLLLSFLSPFDLIQFNYTQICVSFLFDLLHYFTIWELYSFTYSIPHFFIPNSIPISVLKV